METEIEVRSLTGESTKVSILATKTVEELKLLLLQTFSPATATSPHFHLFLKGAKLGLRTQISSHSIKTGDFIVVVPYVKKVRKQTEEGDETATHLNDQNECSTSNAATSAWSAMMQDISSLNEISQNDTNQPCQRSNELRKESSVKTRSKAICKRKLNGDNNEKTFDDLIMNVLVSVESTQMDQDKCKGLMRVLELVNCLCDPLSENCVSKKAFLHDHYTNGDESCLCPSWLKNIMKAFYFLNIYSACGQLLHEKITVIHLKEALEQLSKSGLEISMTDLEHLSVFCPKVVTFVDDEIDSASRSGTLTIFRSSSKDICKAEPVRTYVSQKSQLKTKIVKAMKNREVSFTKALCNIIKLLMNKNDKPKWFSLENLLMFAKKGKTHASVDEARRAHKTGLGAFSSRSNGAWCHETNSLSPAEMVEHLRTGFGASGQIVHVEEINARAANYVDIPNELSEATKSAINRIGVTRLYSHQADSVRASLAGKNVVVSTMTSSGKSLCYNLPVLEVLSQNSLACSIYLFPTKALAQDQLRALLAMMEGFDASSNIGIYDGDTSQADRLGLRDNARLLITNPDTLHVSILPFHGQFSRILSNLRFIVIDEAHTYKGAFGCHTALILRRLRRICSHVYGSDPSFIFCTATSGNPREHAMELAGVDTMKVIQNDGSPSGLKLFVLWNPPLSLKTVSWKSFNKTKSNGSKDKLVICKRSSPLLEISRLFAEIVQHGLRSIAFCKTRKLCELVLYYTREILQETAPYLADSICAYRGGYVAGDRRKIESEFFGGNLRGVAATNALELGIDVGHIDVTLHLGFPGSIASLWQQAGRSGRREKPSLAVYVAFEGPLDQHFMNFPQKLFRGSIECCHIDSQNRQVLEQQLKCAAVEHPLSLLHDEKYFGPGLTNSIMALKTNGYLTTDSFRDVAAQTWSYIGHDKKPSHAVSIRAIENEKYQVIHKQSNEVLEEIEESRAFFQVYEGAVYMHQGKTYLVKELDIHKKLAFCQVADLKYFTKTRDYTDVDVIGGQIAYPTRSTNFQFSRTTAQANICKVTTTWFGFFRIWTANNEIFDNVDLVLPKYSYESQAVWIRVPQSIKVEVEVKEISFRAGLHAAGHAILNVVPLYVICNSSDLASECVNPHDTRYVPERILLYDQHPGGSGISAQVQPIFTELLTAALELLTSCCCSGDTGCPNCSQSLFCHEYNEVLHKEAAIIIIKGILDEEKTCFGEFKHHPNC